MSGTTDYGPAPYSMSSTVGGLLVAGENFPDDMLGEVIFSGGSKIRCLVSTGGGCTVFSREALPTWLNTKHLHPLRKDMDRVNVQCHGGGLMCPIATVTARVSNAANGNGIPLTAIVVEDRHFFGDERVQAIIGGGWIMAAGGNITFGGRGPAMTLHVKPLPHFAYVFTDGACINNGQPNAQAGWSFVAPGEGVEGRGRLYGRQTNQRAELFAIIKALHAYRQGPLASCPIVLYSDSEYAIKCVWEWTPKWKQNGWRNANNQDLIKALDKLVQSMGPVMLRFVHVYSHTGVPGNDMADAMANDAIKTCPAPTSEDPCIRQLLEAN
ncbi:unnamed protein product [Vitrella brassicaformis CCMP3155]|uniref:ribonuclease H n=1 Tax=Vitrella brassicaformis (strain CCMP3155) TaxID=1169540 RepID=A0A0G4F315_VITBC|nr:unnamed protein product [Vitrella brassicaformis CCMP3155]|mmetsp:Transcript_26440/g.75794  ORF Transcript_26440/g.75794 Transcript_26440/m.75794 type:complete len:325 (-) Transcript_26440:821-1795(-)|eukprot:CEM06434.1 unnamed protein product [Vitrella brassicaformis CCMP3155]